MSSPFSLLSKTVAVVLTTGVETDIYVLSHSMSGFPPLMNHTAKYTNPNGPCSTTIMVCLDCSVKIPVASLTCYLSIGVVIFSTAVTLTGTLSGAGRSRDVGAGGPQPGLATPWFHSRALRTTRRWCDSHGEGPIGRA